jgi:hypothetical protein
VPVPAYQVRSPVRPENLDQFLGWLEHPAEINISAANIFDFSLLSEEFGVLELVANATFLPFPTFRATIDKSKLFRIVLEGWKIVFRHR